MKFRRLPACYTTDALGFCASPTRHKTAVAWHGEYLAARGLTFVCSVGCIIYLVEIIGGRTSEKPPTCMYVWIFFPLLLLLLYRQNSKYITSSPTHSKKTRHHLWVVGVAPHTCICTKNHTKHAIFRRVYLCLFGLSLSAATYGVQAVQQHTFCRFRHIPEDTNKTARILLVSYY